MTRYLSLLLLLASLPAVAAESAPVRLSEPVLSDAGSETFGAPVPADAEPVRLADVLASADQYVGAEVVFTARIGQVCQKKGCFFIARDGDAIVRVTFRDYAFFIPTDAGGKRAVFSGVLERDTLSDADAAHYSEDLGESDERPVKSGPGYSVIASAIRIHG